MGRFVEDEAVQLAIVRILERWGRLPLGDVLGLLTAEQRLRYRSSLLRALVEDGAVCSVEIGDEPILSLPEAPSRLPSSEVEQPLSRSPGMPNATE